jgi:hypothetical protein
VIKDYLVLVHKIAANGVNVFYQYGSVPKVGGSCTPTVSKVENTGPVYSTYDEQSREYSSYPIVVKTNMNMGSISAEMVNMRNELIAEASSAYDVLTDIAELKDIPRTITQVSGDLIKILGTLKSRFGRNVLRGAASIRPLDLLKHPTKMYRMLGNEWMNYRYGIMPLVYSYRDCIKLMRRGQDVRTFKHRSITPNLTGQPLPPSTSIYRLEDTTGSVELRGEVFQYFTSTEVARLSSVGINPLVTAWELIPYSFVFDWFIDVGSSIAASTSQSWAQTKYACLSTRTKLTKTIWVHLPTSNYSCSIVNKIPVLWWGSAPPATPSVIVNNPEALHLLSEEITDTYSRGVVPCSGVAPVFNPSLNWRRLIDSAVLTLNHLGSLLRHL